eukprot:3519021-Amphidinium_carterae.1
MIYHRSAHGLPQRLLMIYHKTAYDLPPRPLMFCLVFHLRPLTLNRCVAHVDVYWYSRNIHYYLNDLNVCELMKLRITVTHYRPKFFGLNLDYRLQPAVHPGYPR